MPSISSTTEPNRERDLRENHARMEAIIRELHHNPETERKPVSECADALYLGARTKVLLRKIADDQDIAVDRLHSFMMTEFGEESETRGWLGHTIKYRLNDYYIVEDERQRIIAFSNSQYLPLKGGNDGLVESIIAVWHVTTIEALRNQGLATEIYRRIYRDALTTARMRRHSIKGVIGEAVAEVEAFLNRMGRKRLYYEDAAGNVHEVPYICPPLDFSMQTGEGIGPAVPEHVMLRLVDGTEVLSSDDIMRMVEAMYREYLGAADNYESKGAYLNAESKIIELMDGLRFKLLRSKGRSIFAMSRAERDRKRQRLAAKGRQLFEV